MSVDTRQPVPYSEEPDYFGFGNAAGYAEDFRTGAEGAVVKGEKWAKYERQPNLLVLVTQLQEGIFSIVAYPPAGFEVALVSDIEQKEIFRGWILQYRADPYGWRVLAASQEVGEDEFKRLRKQYNEV
ncbi:hypothetical protein ES708_21782 [subsurface metagenome]